MRIVNVQCNIQMICYRCALLEIHIRLLSNVTPINIKIYYKYNRTFGRAEEIDFRFNF